MQTFRSNNYSHPISPNFAFASPTSPSTISQPGSDGMSAWSSGYTSYGLSSATPSHFSGGSSNHRYQSSHAEDYESARYSPSMAEGFFRRGNCGRAIHTVEGCPYGLPCDETEQNRLDSQHELMKMMTGLTYNGPLPEVLRPGWDLPRNQTRTVLDIGTGTGLWAIEMAEEFPEVEVVGVDIVPIQRRSVPHNVAFETFDVNEGIPYEDESFDVIHMRFCYSGITNFPNLLSEIQRLLRPNGLLLIMDLEPFSLHSASGHDHSTLSGVSALESAIDFSLKEAFKDRTGRNCGGNCVFEPERVSGVIDGTWGFEGVQWERISTPVGGWDGDRHLRILGQMASENIREQVDSWRSLLMNHGGYTSKEVDDINRLFLRDLNSYRLCQIYHSIHARKCG